MGKFKVGDKAVVTAEEYSSVPVGTPVTIYEILNDDCYTATVDGGDGFDWCFNGKSLDHCPKLWRDMWDEEKGALLSAYHRGEQIELYNYEGSCMWVPCLTEDLWKDDLAYRVDTEPKQKKVTLYTGSIDYFAAASNPMRGDTHRIVFDLIDGKPDPGSIRMEEL